MTSLSPIAAGTHLGPVYTKAARGQYNPVESKTSSRTDSVFQDVTSKQKLQFNDFTHPNPIPQDKVPEPKVAIREYRKMMREHVERRILFSFQQLIVTHKTKLHFESVGALDQGASAQALKIEGSSADYVKRNAAHSCGNPCLIAYDKEEWENRETKKPEGFVFLKDTDYYKSANATMNMPRWMNEADREIEEKTQHSKLREIGLEIINRNSQGELTPDEGVLEYLEASLNEVEAAKQRLEKANKDPEVQEVLTYYEKYLTKIKDYIESDPLFLQNFLNIKMDEKSSKRVILKMRYAAIRNCQIDQAVLIQKVEALKESVLKNLKAPKKPNHFEAAFEAAFIERTPQSDRARVEKLLNFSPSNYEAQFTGATLTQYTNLKNKISKLDKELDPAIKELTEKMGELRSKEITNRSKIVKELRQMKKWSQRRLSRETLKLFPNAVASQPTICRIEREGKLVTAPIAIEFSEVFGVDPGLFMPQFFYE